MPDLPACPSLEHLRKQAKARRRRSGVHLTRVQYELAREYGFASWPALVRRVHVLTLSGLERALMLAEVEPLRAHLRADPGAAVAEIDGLPPLLLLLRRSIGGPGEVRRCAELVLDAGADPDSSTAQDGGGWGISALFDAVERADLDLVRLLVSRGATPDEDAFYHACEQSDTAYLDLLYRPGFENVVNHKLDFEDAAGLRWFLDRGVDVNAHGCLHWAIGRGRGAVILRLLIEAGAEVNLPHPRTGHRPLAVAARCGHLAAYDLLAGLGATADLGPVEVAVLAVARGESVLLPDAPPPLPGIPGRGSGWLLGQLAALGRTEVVRALLDAGAGVDTRGWSNFTPIDQAAMHGRVQTVRLLIEAGADLHDCAFDDEGPTPLDCALWGLANNRAADGDYVSTVRALVSASAPTRHSPPTGDPAIDALLSAALPVEPAIDDPVFGSGAPGGAAAVQDALRPLHAASGGRGEVLVDTGLTYGPDDPVRIRARRRSHRYDLTDDGAAVARAGAPPGWRERAQQLVADEGFNVNRRGVTFVSAVEGTDIAGLVVRLAALSRTVHLALLELDAERE